MSMNTRIAAARKKLEMARLAGASARRANIKQGQCPYQTPDMRDSWGLGWFEQDQENKANKRGK